MADVSDIYKEQETAENTFRDHLSTVDKRGKRIWIYPKKPKGQYTRYRSLVSYALLIVLITMPFLKKDGMPFFLFDILERRFIIFGQAFWPQDFFLFVIGMITVIIFIVLFTVIFGRIFCGWICPQTIFMEGVFRKIEYWIEGDYIAQKNLDKQGWDREKISKKTLKHLLFIGVSVIIMHTFMAYLIGVEKVGQIIQEGPAEHITGFIVMVTLTGLFYGVFSQMREQVCTTICPYGRLQGVLLDRQSIVVAYDHVRGEPRGKLQKHSKENSPGDCIDCKQCVYVCPTGIDIRHGTQLECINCTACVDTCDSIMDRIGKPKGLIRYASEQNIADKLPFRLTGRMRAYSVMLLILTGVMFTLLANRSDFETTILRTPGITYQEREDGLITNLYQLKMVNKTNTDINIRLELIEPSGNIEMVGKSLSLQQQEVTEGTFFVVIPFSELSKMSTEIVVGVYSEDKIMEKIKTKFLGPAK